METRNINYVYLCQNSSFDISSSLIICTFKRTESLLTLFEHLYSYNLSDLPKEIIIVDGSQDELSFNAIRDFLKINPIDRNIIFIHSQPGLTMQRNIGLDLAKGQILHYLDDDCYPNSNYFDEIELLFSLNKDVGGITGYISNEIEAKIPLKFKIRTFLGIAPLNGFPGKYYNHGSSVPKPLLCENKIKDFTEVDVVSGASMSWRKQNLIDAGGFSEFFLGYAQGEDMEVALRVGKSAIILLAVNAKCIHKHESSGRPNLYKKGIMEVYNRHYIWYNLSKGLSFNDKLRFWADIVVVNVLFAIMQFFRSGFKFQYLQLIGGYFIGIYRAVFKQKKFVSKRSVFFKYDQL